MMRVPANLAFGFDEERLGLVDAAVVARFIAKPAVPGRGPDYADECTEHEDAAPGKEAEEPGYKEGREAARNVGRGEEIALHAAAFAQRNPTRERQSGVGPRAGFSGAEEEADDEQAGVVPRPSGSHGECRPPDDDARQHAARADFLTPPRAEDFERRIGNGEGAEHEAHLQFGEMQIARDLGSQRGDANPIEVGHGGEHEEEAAGLKTDACGLHWGIMGWAGMSGLASIMFAGSAWERHFGLLRGVLRRTLRGAERVRPPGGLVGVI